MSMEMTLKQIELFWAKVEKTDPDECWNWTASTSKGGYGEVNLNGKSRRATHLSLILSGSNRPGRLYALHHCDNPRCVNPAHLYWGDDAQNTRDKITRNRMVIHRGEKHANSKLTEDRVIEILNSNEAQTACAKRFGITQGMVGHIRRGVAWSHISVAAVRKGYAKGAATGHAKVTPDIVRAIRAANGLQREIAEQYGVAQTLVSQIKRRTIWKHVD